MDDDGAAPVNTTDVHACRRGELKQLMKWLRWGSLAVRRALDGGALRANKSCHLRTHGRIWFMPGIPKAR